MPNKEIEITDPERLREIIGAPAPAYEKEITDPERLASIANGTAPTPLTAAGLGKAGVAGVARGGISLAGLPGDVRSLYAAGADWLGVPAGVQSAARKIARQIPLANAVAFGPTSTTIQEKVEDVTGPLYKPQNVAEEYVGAIGEMAPAALMPGGLAARAAQVVLPAVASEAAGQAVKGTAAEPYARAVGGFVGGMGANKTARALENWSRARKLPTDPLIQTVKEGLYKASDDATIGTLTDPKELKTFGKSLKRELNRAGYRDTPEGSPGAHGVVRGIMKPGTGQAPDVYDLTKSRVAAKNLFAKGEGPAANILLNRLDDAIDTLSPAGVGVLRAADRENSLQEGLKTINKRLAHAQRRAESTHSGKGLGQMIRQNLTSFRNNEKLMRGLRPEEIAQIDRTIAGSASENLSRNMSNRYGGGGGLGQSLLGLGAGGAAGYGTGDLSTGLLVGGGVAGLGMGLRALSNRLTLNQAKKLEYMLRARSAAALPNSGLVPVPKLPERLGRGVPYGLLGAMTGRGDEEYQFTNPPERLGDAQSLLGLAESGQKLLSTLNPISSAQAADTDEPYSDQQLAKIRLGQMLRDKAAAKKSGIDTSSSAWGNYNAKIRDLRQQLR